MVFCKLLLGLTVVVAFSASSPAQVAPDTYIYYIRTHGGATPPPGTDPSDHSDEYGPETPASSATEFAPPPVPGKTDLAGGVVATNLGKGDWIWEMPQTQTRLGVSTTQGVINYEVSMGMQWITVKCADGGDTNSWAQFSPTLVNQAHAAGLKIFGWAYVYGSKFGNLQGEINAALSCMAKGADGLIIDAEIEYETNATRVADATTYCQAIKNAYPSNFLAHAPFPYISLHAGFPYSVFGYYCDAVMPQDYWGAFAITPNQMVSDMDTQWKNWQNALTGTNVNAIKPIVPLAQSYAPVTGSQISNFVFLIKTDASPATAGGYHGVSFWDCQERNADMDSAVGPAAIGNYSNPPAISMQPSNRSVDQGSTVTLTVGAVGTSPLSYQWRKNNLALPGATTSALAFVNSQPTSSGQYSVVVTNSLGSVTSSSATLTINSTQALVVVYADNFDVNSSANWNLFQGSGDGVSDYTATWAFDYTSTTFTSNGVVRTIPVAPSTTNGTKLGLKLTVNKNDSDASIAGVSLYPKSQNFSSNYVLRFDMWVNYAGGAGGTGATGTTEFVTCGINHTGTRVNWGSTNASASDGLWFTTTGEGGAASDYRAYVGNPSGNPTQLSVAASGLLANGAVTDDAGADPFYLALFPSPPYETAGSPGKHWVKGEVSQMNGVITWRLNGTVVAQRTNTSSYTSGNVMLGYMDIFSSISNPKTDNYVIFDNVQVLVPGFAPTFTTQPVSQSVVQGNGVTFTTTAGGTAPLTYQWKFNNTNIGLATGTSYTIASAQPTDAGNYSVAVSNSVGGISSSNAALTVFSPPAITNQPVDFSGDPGSDATFLVQASGTAPLGYQWFYNGTSVPGATLQLLEFNPDTANQAGQYWVVVSNNYGSVTSAVVNLFITGPPVILTQPQGLTAGAGSNATFTVSAVGTMPLNYQWFFGGAAIGGATDTSYTVLSATATNQGNYSVLVTNGLGPAASSNAFLTVNSPAQAAQFQSIIVLPDGRIQMSLTGSVGGSYEMFGSPDLSGWQSLATFVMTNGTYLFIDNAATNNPQQFYRAKTVP